MMNLKFKGPSLTLLQKFRYNPRALVNANPLWRGNLIPHYPIERNIMIVNEKQYDVTKLIRDMNRVFKNTHWKNKESDGSWKSITLKGYNGNTQDWLENTELGTNENNKYKYTQAVVGCNYFKDIFDSLNTEIYLVRLLKLRKHSKIKYHTDEVVFKNKWNIIRCHLPIVTDNKNIMKLGMPLQAPKYHIWRAEDLYSKHMSAGNLWYTNVNMLHSVENNSDIDRIHLVIDLRPTAEILEKIYNISPYYNAP